MLRRFRRLPRPCSVCTAVQPSFYSAADCRRTPLGSKTKPRDEPAVMVRQTRCCQGSVVSGLTRLTVVPGWEISKSHDKRDDRAAVGIDPTAMEKQALAPRDKQIVAWHQPNRVARMHISSLRLMAWRTLRRIRR